MKALTLALALSLVVLNVAAETVTTTDGKKILLNKDGTYKILNAEVTKQDEIVEVSSHYLEHNVDKYQRKTIRFMPIFHNKSDKNIIALKFETKFLDPFGDVVSEVNGQSEEMIQPGKKSTANMFYVFKDNKFINGETYDKLLSSVTNKTGKTKTTVTAIVFEGGEAIKL